MIILHDFRLSKNAISILKQYGTPLSFNAQNITNELLAGHPDIFCCLGLDKPIFAPNTPIEILNALKMNNIDFRIGKTFVGKEKTNITPYNVTISKSYIIHYQRYTDEIILEQSKNRTFINVRQSFSRCSTISFDNDSFLTSDTTIYNKLQQLKLNCLYVNPKQIILPGVNYGLIGGCMGTFDKNVFINGSLSYHADGKTITSWIKNLHYHIIELNNSPLFDCGGLLCLK